MFSIYIKIAVNVSFQPEITAKDMPTPVRNEDFLADLRRTGISHSDDCQDRLFRAHGTCSVLLFLNPIVLLNPDIPCLCKQCRSRSVGF